MSSERPYLFDVSRLIWRRWAGRLPTGIDRVCLAYLDHYRSRSRAVIQWRGFRGALSATASDRLFDLLQNPGPAFRRAMAQAAVLSAWHLHRPLPGQLYINVGHTGLDDPGLLRWEKATQVRPVYMVHDLIPISHPEYCRAGEDVRHRLRIANLLRSARAIIGNSQDTLDRLDAFRIDQGIASVPTVAALLGMDIASTEIDTVPPEVPTFVTIGTIEARKNHLFLLQIWSRLAETLGSAAPRLVVIGQRGWESEQAADLLDRSPWLARTVIEIPGGTDRQVAEHLHNATALVFPSLAEGFGLPLVEALAAGTPVIASNLKVFREVAGDIPDYLDPLDGPGWTQAIIDYCQPESPRREAQLTRLRGYRPPTWANHFQMVDRLLGSL